jgi:hypothetical protein
LSNGNHEESEAAFEFGKNFALFEQFGRLLQDSCNSQLNVHQSLLQDFSIDAKRIMREAKEEAKAKLSIFQNSSAKRSLTKLVLGDSRNRALM